jgi:hypothetical protein
MVDEEGVNVIQEMERNYANAGNASIGKVVPPVTRARTTEDERMPDEWNRTRNQEGEVVGYIGQRAIRRTIEQDEQEENRENEEDDLVGANAGVMAALAQLRKENH